MSFCKGFSQGGSNADVVIADAFLKGITDGVDWDTAYEAVISDAEGEFSMGRRIADSQPPGNISPRLTFK